MLSLSTNPFISWSSDSSPFQVAVSATAYLVECVVHFDNLVPQQRETMTVPRVNINSELIVLDLSSAAAKFFPLSVSSVFALTAIYALLASHIFQ